LNRSEIAKNGEGRRAYYIYVRQGTRSLDLMNRVAESCGAIGLGNADRILRNPSLCVIACSLSENQLHHSRRRHTLGFDIPTSITRAESKGWR